MNKLGRKTDTNNEKMILLKYLYTVKCEKLWKTGGKVLRKSYPQNVDNVDKQMGICVCISKYYEIKDNSV